MSGSRHISKDPPTGVDPTTHSTQHRRSITELRPAPWYEILIQQIVYRFYCFHLSITNDKLKETKTNFYDLKGNFLKAVNLMLNNSSHFYNIRKISSRTPDNPVILYRVVCAAVQ